MAIAFVWGGSGGHVTPVVALLRHVEKDSELRQKCKEIYRFGELDGQEYPAAQQFSRVTFVPVTSGKWRRYDFWKTLLPNLLDMVFVIKGFFLSLVALRKYHIKVVFCKWSHVAIPVCSAAAVLGIPVVLHESDILPGLANRIVSKWATIKFAGFPNVFGPDTQFVGQLLTTDLLRYDQTELRKTLPCTDQTTVLVMGWSQGATVLYETLLALLAEDWTQEFQFHIILWTRNAHLADAFKSFSHVHTYPYLRVDEVASLCAYCDLSLTRGGVTSLAEQQLFGIKKGIVPLPFTWGNHQEFNARRYVENCGDACILQNIQLQQQLADFLDRYRHFKKEFVVPERSQLEKVPQLIWQTLLQLHA
jgi:UDP-N-acetylglucosamine--N-acetylmuramyl-(pentapeptide) pyrophosphoryl-undecaprenol N-acetylglucosamine transferase